MLRTQVYLPKTLYQNIDIVAKKEGKPKAQIIREVLEKGLEKRGKRQTVGEALLEFAELGKKLKARGPKDLSVNHDKYLYEEA